MQGIHRWPVNSPHKWPVTREMFPFDDVIMALIHLCPLSIILISDIFSTFGLQDRSMSWESEWVYVETDIIWILTENVWYFDSYHNHKYIFISLRPEISMFWNSYCNFNTVSSSAFYGSDVQYTKTKHCLVSANFLFICLLNHCRTEFVKDT